MPLSVYTALSVNTGGSDYVRAAYVYGYSCDCSRTDQVSQERANPIVQLTLYMLLLSFRERLLGLSRNWDSAAMLGPIAAAFGAAIVTSKLLEVR